jgi:glycosyltransferase involved in cell wall biosynthesis
MCSVNTPTFSIVVCTYNRAAQLARTLDTLNSLEVPARVATQLVVVNNNSPDDTASVCRRFAAESRLPCVYREEMRQGLSHARNCGLSAADGEIVIFTDDDITMPSNWLANYADVFRRMSPDCVFGKIVPDWGNQGPPAWYDDSFSMIFGKLDYGDREFVVTSRRHEFFGANFAVRKDVVTDYGGFDPALGRTPDRLYISEERKLFLRFLADGRKMVYSPDIRVYHHVSERMRTKEYIEQYYRDTAVSLANIAPANPGRQLCGVPYFRWIELARALLMFLPQAVLRIAEGKTKRLFPLRLELLRTARVVALHLARRNRVRR